MQPRRLLPAIFALLPIALLVVGAAPPAQGATTALTPVATWSTPRFGAFYQQNITGEVFSSPAVGDVDGDGQPDVVAGFPDGNVYAWHTNGTRFFGFWTGAGAVQASPALVDFNGDGVLDILVANTAGKVWVVTGRGQTLFAAHDTCFPMCGIFGTPVAADLDHDGHLDVVASSWDQRIHAWRANGSELPGFPRDIFDTSWSSPAIADIDGDGWPEIVVGGDCDGVPGQPCYPARGGYLWVIRHDGSVQPGFPRFFPDQVTWSSPAVIDLDGDRRLDIVVGTGNMPMTGGRAVYAVDRFGHDLPGWPVAVGGTTMSSPAVGDVNGDGSPDVAILADDGRLYVIDRFGHYLPGWPQCAANDRVNGCPRVLHASPSIADVDGDGQQEIVIGGEQWLRVFSGNGAVETQMPTVSGTVPLTSAPTIASVGGTTWIVQGTAFIDPGSSFPSTGNVWIWTSGHAPGGVAWPTFKQNFHRTGGLFDEVPPTAAVGALAASQSSTRVAVSWSGSDVGTGIDHFDVDVQDNGGPWARWMNAAPPSSRSGSSASGGFPLYGFAGHTYGIRARAADVAGNIGAWSPTVSTAIAANATVAQPLTAGYAVDAFGDLSTLDSPPAAGPSWPGFPIGRGIALRPAGNGYVLDGWGGIHPIGGAPGVSASAYWPGWDIARGIAVNDDGASGYVVDGWGGLHPFGGAAAITNGPYWPGWDIARGIVLRPDSTASAPKGYILDGWGGLHPFGGAPALSGGGYWPGWDIARGVTLNPDGATGYVLEGWGGLHPLGGAAPVRNGPYWYGWDIARGVAAIGTAGTPAGYVLDGFGGIHAFGNAPLMEVSQYWGRDVARGIAVRP